MKYKTCADRDKEREREREVDEKRNDRRAKNIMNHIESVIYLEIQREIIGLYLWTRVVDHKRRSDRHNVRLPILVSVEIVR